MYIEDSQAVGRVYIFRVLSSILKREHFFFFFDMNNIHLKLDYNKIHINQTYRYKKKRCFMCEYELICDTCFVFIYYLLLFVDVQN